MTVKLITADKIERREAALNDMERELDEPAESADERDESKELWYAVQNLPAGSSKARFIKGVGAAMGIVAAAAGAAAKARKRSRERVRRAEQTWRIGSRVWQSMPRPSKTAKMQVNMGVCKAVSGNGNVMGVFGSASNSKRALN